MTAPTFDAERSARVLNNLNNTWAALYILPYLRMATLEDVVKLWLQLHEPSKQSPIANQSELL